MTDRTFARGKLVEKDLSALWKTDLEGAPLAAVPDFKMMRKGMPRRLGLPRDTYFNSGVMYMPSKWLRTSWSGSKNKANGEFFDGPWDDAYSFFDDEWMDGRTLDDDLYTTWMRPNGIAPGEWVSNKEALVDISPAPALNEESEAEE